MRSPSLKMLRKHFGFLVRDGREHLIKRLCAKRDDPETLAYLLTSPLLKATEEYARKCYNSPYNSRMWRTTLVLHAIDTLVEGHGVEGLGEGEHPSYAPPYEYVNMGDPYATTLVYNREQDRLFVGCWGDIAEKLPAQE